MLVLVSPFDMMGAENLVIHFLTMLLWYDMVMLVWCMLFYMLNKNPSQKLAHPVDSLSSEKTHKSRLVHRVQSYRVIHTAKKDSSKEVIKK